MTRSLELFALVLTIAVGACSTDPQPGGGEVASEEASDDAASGGSGDLDDDADDGEDSAASRGDGSDSDTADSGTADEPGTTCSDIDLIPMDVDPDQGFIDITEFCVAELNMYRAMENLEPYTVRQDGICCSAQEAEQAWIDGTFHNNSYCDWVSQGAAGGGRNPDGTAELSVEWVPRLFWQERGETYEESGGHYQAMMRPETREVACGFYAADRDDHRVVVNYW